MGGGASICCVARAVMVVMSTAVPHILVDTHWTTWQKLKKTRKRSRIKNEQGGLVKRGAT